MRVATYIRTGTQPDDAFSVAHQRRLLREQVRKQGWRLVEEFADFGAAGPNAAGLQRLRRDASAARFDAVLVTYPDRLGKRIDTLNEAIEALSATGITVLSLASPLPLTSPAAIFMLRMAAALAAAERDDEARHHRERTGTALARRRASGR